ncbi:hypothetical protein HanPSC8_Chr11g0466681 [Helianthus annuus]|nr:hypothetical protein HanPSC8_Chr11g0466681 [Helianthus annuus]
MLLGTSTSTIRVSDMQARMNLSCHLDLDFDWECDSDLGSDGFEVMPKINLCFKFVNAIQI